MAPLKVAQWGRIAPFERLEVRTIGRIVRAVAKAKGFDPADWHPHLLRHACGTQCHDNGMPLQAVAQMLGHARLPNPPPHKGENQ